MTTERLTKSWKTKTWKKEDMPWKKLTAQSPRKNVFEILRLRLRLRPSKLATSFKKSARADVTCCPSSTRLHQRRQDFSMPGMRQRKTETSNTLKVSPPRPYTFNHEVEVDVFDIVDSVGMRFSILNAVCMGTTCDQAWIVRESENLGSPIVTRMSTSFRTRLDASGWLALACSQRSRNTQRRRIWFDSCQERCGDQTCRIGSTGTHRKSGTTRRRAQEDDVAKSSRTRTPQAENRWT